MAAVRAALWATSDRQATLIVTMAVQQGLCGVEQVAEAAARASLQVSRSGRHIGQEAIQLHGGIGMTAEYAVGHYTSRLTALNHWLGDAREQVALLSAGLTDHTVLDPLDA